MNVMKLAFARPLIYIETIVLGLQKVMARRGGKNVSIQLKKH